MSMTIDSISDESISLENYNLIREEYKEIIKSYEKASQVVNQYELLRKIGLTTRKKEKNLDGLKKMLTKSFVLVKIYEAAIELSGYHLIN